MRGEVQGDNECVLATVADLTKTPLSQVRATALAITGKPTWNDVIKESAPHISSLYWRTVFYLCDCFDTTKKLARAIVQASSFCPETRLVCAAKSLDTAAVDLPSDGRGVIVLVFDPLGPKETGHIVAWENGLAYDSNRTGVGETLANLKFRYGVRGYSIQGISQL